MPQEFDCWLLGGGGGGGWGLLGLGGGVARAALASRAMVAMMVLKCILKDCWDWISRVRSFVVKGLCFALCLE